MINDNCDDDGMNKLWYVDTYFIRFKSADEINYSDNNAANNCEQSDALLYEKMYVNTCEEAEADCDRAI